MNQPLKSWDWKRIKDLPTAIIAVSYSKGVSETTARIMLSDTKMLCSTKI
jgi:hypothetical protein